MMDIAALLAATGLPGLVDLTGDARTAAVQGVGGARASGVNLGHASWLAKGGTASVNSVSLEGGVTVGVNDTGWPENGAGGGGDGTVTAGECMQVWRNLLSSGPSVATGTGSDYQATVASPICTFALTATAGRTIAYDSSNGTVAITVP